jgi:hypothetical protein
MNKHIKKIRDIITSIYSDLDIYIPYIEIFTTELKGQIVIRIKNHNDITNFLKSFCEKKDYLFSNLGYFGAHDENIEISILTKY